MTGLPFDPDLDSEGQGWDAQPAERPFEPRPDRGRTSSRFQVRAVLAVSAGGAVGGCARYGVDRLLPTVGGRLPWSTLTVNVVGALLLALLLVLMLEVWRPTRYVRPFLAVGVLGSFTTFSTLIVDVDRLFADGYRGTAAGYLAASLVAGLAATSVGLAIGRVVVNRCRAARRRVTP